MSRENKTLMSACIMFWNQRRPGHDQRDSMCAVCMWLYGSLTEDEVVAQKIVYLWFS